MPKEPISEMRNTILHIVFIVIACGVLLAELTDNTLLTWIAKPLIMPWIITYYLLNISSGKYSVKLILAFTGAWLGDILLMFQAGGSLFFIFGLGSFLICQLLYATIFLKEPIRLGIRSNWLFRKPLWLLLLLLYMCTLYIAMYPGLDSFLRIPVFVYAVAITSMLTAALSRKGVVAKISFQFIVVGALLFVLSDSLIGLNKFSIDIPFAGFWILLTYMAAQYFIVRGLVYQNK